MGQGTEPGRASGTAPAPSTPPRSAFVTALAWNVIVLAALTTLVAVLQNILLRLVLPADALRDALDEVTQGQPIPPFVVSIVEHLDRIVLLILVVSALTLAAGIGLLRRRPWARVVVIAILAASIVANLAGMALPFFMSSASVPDAVPATAGEEFTTMTPWLIGANLVVGVIFSLVSGWLIMRLGTSEIRDEFTHAPRT